MDVLAFQNAKTDPMGGEKVRGLEIKRAFRWPWSKRTLAWDESSYVERPTKTTVPDIYINVLRGDRSSRK